MNGMELASFRKWRQINITVLSINAYSLGYIILSGREWIIIYHEICVGFFFHEGAVLPLFVTTIINRKSMGKWMSFFLFIQCLGESGVLVFLSIYENVGRILSNSSTSTFKTGWISHCLFLVSFILWFIFLDLTPVSSCSGWT